METCKVGFAQSAVDFSYEVKSCMKSQPQCLRNRDLCLGRCDGAGGGLLTQDFATTFVKQELSVRSIGSTAIENGRANCITQSRIIHVPLFDPGENFALYAARLRVRGGFNGKRFPTHNIRTHTHILTTCSLRARSNRSEGVREGAAGVRRHPARAGEGTILNLRYRHR
jgi:hypothetical protein